MTLLNIRNPRTGAYDTEIKATSPQALAGHARDLRAASPIWSGTPVEDRIARMLAFADAIQAHRADIQAALEHDTGRRRIATVEIDGVIGAIRGRCAMAPALLATDWSEGISNPAMRYTNALVPYALVGVISPWNFPLLLSLIDAIPALLAGATVLIKPSEVTPRFVAPLEAAIKAAGLDNVLRFIQGDGRLGAELIAQVDAVCFTGSVATGRKVAMAAAENMIPAFLELGGKDPMIVLASADIDHAVTAALRGSVLSTGQACQSIERIYVARDIAQEFTNRLITEARAVPLNWPDMDAGVLGPLIFDKQASVLQRHIDDAKAKGANVACGGRIEHHGGGIWLRPTVLTEVHHEMDVMREESFGPLLPIMVFDSEEEAITLANDSAYGLSAAVFAGTVAEAEAVARRLQAGAVSINDAALTALFFEAENTCFKLSGLGPSRKGAAGFLRYLRQQSLIANTGLPLPLAAFAEGVIA